LNSHILKSSKVAKGEEKKCRKKTSKTKKIKRHLVKNIDYMNNKKHVVADVCFEVVRQLFFIFQLVLF